MSVFTETLDKELHTKGLRKSDLVNDLHIADSTVRGWWAKNCMPALDVAYRVSQYLGVSLEYLLTGKKNADELDERQKKVVEYFSMLDELDSEEVLTLLELKSRRYVAEERKSATGG